VSTASSRQLRVRLSQYEIRVMEESETLMIKMGIGRVIEVQRGRMRRRVGLVELVLLCKIEEDCRLGFEG